jgi:hypothetical protein
MPEAVTQTPALHLGEAASAVQLSARQRPWPRLPAGCGTACAGSVAVGQRCGAWRGAGWPAGRRPEAAPPPLPPASTLAPACCRDGCAPLQAGRPGQACRGSINGTVRAVPPQHAGSNWQQMQERARSSGWRRTCERVQQQHERRLLQSIDPSLQQAQQQASSEHEHTAAGAGARAAGWGA